MWHSIRIIVEIDFKYSALTGKKSYEDMHDAHTFVSIVSIFITILHRGR